MVLVLKYLNNTSSLLLLSLLMTLFSCKKSDTDPKMPDEGENTLEQTPVDSAQVMETLTAIKRYWILEKIIIKTKVYERDVSEDTTFFDKKKLYSLYDGAFQFSFYPGYSTIKKYYQYGPSLSAGWSYYANGLHGNSPYGISELRIYNAFPEPKPVGFWAWDGNEKRLSISPLTRYRFLGIPDSSSAVYLDPLNLPKYTTLQQAMAAGKPERIKVIAENFNEELGNHKYIYTLRAAWVVERKYNQDRWQAQFDVIY